MSDQTPSELLLVHVEYIRERVDAIDNGLKDLNGRTRDTEQAIAVLKDRADESRNAGRTWGLTAGGVGSAIAAWLAHLFKGQ